MTKNKMSYKYDPSKKVLDKTDWQKLYRQTQLEADREALQDKENPVLKKARFRRLKG